MFSIKIQSNPLFPIYHMFVRLILALHLVTDDVPPVYHSNHTLSSLENLNSQNTAQEHLYTPNVM